MSIQMSFMHSHCLTLYTIIQVVALPLLFSCYGPFFALLHACWYIPCTCCSSNSDAVYVAPPLESWVLPSEVQTCLHSLFGALVHHFFYQKILPGEKNCYGTHLSFLTEKNRVGLDDITHRWEGALVDCSWWQPSCWAWRCSMFQFLWSDRRYQRWSERVRRGVDNKRRTH